MTQKRHEKSAKTMFRYHHLGIPTTSPKPGEIYLDHLKVYVTDHESNPFGIQWMRYDQDCPLPELVKTIAHVAFEVRDLQQAILGKNVIIPPNSPSPGVHVAFIEENGAPVEFLQFDKKSIDFLGE
jgi:hypothetical protein